MEYITGFLIIGGFVLVIYAIIWFFKALGRGAVTATYRATHTEEKQISDALLDKATDIEFAGHYQDFYDRLIVQERIVKTGKLLFSEEGRFEYDNPPMEEGGVWTIDLLLGGDPVGLAMFTPIETESKIRFNFLKAQTTAGIIDGLDRWLGLLEGAKALGQQMIAEAGGRSNAQSVPGAQLQSQENGEQSQENGEQSQDRSAEGVPKQPQQAEVLSGQNQGSQGLLAQGIHAQGASGQTVPTQSLPPQAMPPQTVPTQSLPPQAMPPQTAPPQGLPPQGPPSPSI